MTGLTGLMFVSRRSDMAKKLSEMEPFERVEPRLKGLTNEEAEDVAVKILAQVIAKHVYSIKDGDEYVTKLLEKLFKASDDYAKNHSMELAMAAVFASRRNVK